MATKLVDISDKYQRLVILLDMDCFYCQVEEKLNPALKGKPVAVVQHNSWMGGGIISANYMARAKGIGRQMRGDEAKALCPDIELVSVPTAGGKADLSRYRKAGMEVCESLRDFTNFLQRASIDEFYVDISIHVFKRMEELLANKFKMSPKKLRDTFVVGQENIGLYMHDLLRDTKVDENSVSKNSKFVFIDENQSDTKLLIAATIANEMREAILEKTGYECSVGIAHNKMLAKLACAMNKPNKQTILPNRMIQPLFSSLPVKSIQGLGGKLGTQVREKLNIKFVGEILNFSEKDLKKLFNDKIGSWLYLIGQGIDLEPVVPRLHSKSIGCSKNFPGKNKIKDLATLNSWLKILADELCNRLNADIIENSRKGTQMSVILTQEKQSVDVQNTRSTELTSYDPKIIATAALNVIKNITHRFFLTINNVFKYPIKHIGLNVGKFTKIEPMKNTLTHYLEQMPTEIATSENGAKELSSKSNPSTSVSRQALKNMTIQSFFTNVEKKKAVFSSVSDDSNINSGNTENISVENAENDSIESEAPNSTLFVVADQQASSEKRVLPKFNPEDFLELSFNKLYKPGPEDYEKCKECSGRFLKWNMQTHLDYHLAMKIQREFREEQGYNTRIGTTTTLGKRKSSPKKTIKKKTKKTHETITKFLEKKPAIENSIKDCDDKYLCKICGKHLHKINEAEHRDYHIALDMQKSFNLRGSDKDASGPSTSTDTA